MSPQSIAEPLYVLIYTHEATRLPARQSNSIGIYVFSITPSDKAIIDIGANLTHESFANDFEDVIHRAGQANINHMIITGSDVEDSHKAATLATENSDLFSATAGIHPHYAEQYSDDAPPATPARDAL